MKKPISAATTASKIVLSMKYRTRPETTVLAIGTRAQVRSEKAEERLCDDFALRTGWQVVRFSQARATRQTAGIPDRLYFNQWDEVAIWFEVKRATGKLSKEQHNLLANLHGCGHYIGCGTLDKLIMCLERPWDGARIVEEWAKRGYR